MHKSELPELSTRLAQLADALGGPAPSAAGMLVWLDALAECAMPDVLAVLVDWPKAHAKMPLPADVLRLARERVSARIEETAERHRRTAGSLAETVAALRGNLSPQARQARAQLAALMLAPARRDPKAWAKRLQAREEAGEALPAFVGEAWRRALRSRAHHAPAPRSDDDLELLAEREAIQAETFA